MSWAGRPSDAYQSSRDRPHVLRFSTETEAHSLVARRRQPPSWGPGQVQPSTHVWLGQPVSRVNGNHKLASCVRLRASSILDPSPSNLMNGVNGGSNNDPALSRKRTQHVSVRFIMVISPSEESAAMINEVHSLPRFRYNG